MSDSDNTLNITNITNIYYFGNQKFAIYIIRFLWFSGSTLTSLFVPDGAELVTLSSVFTGLFSEWLSSKTDGLSDEVSLLIILIGVFITLELALEEFSKHLTLAKTLENEQTRARSNLCFFNSLHN
ncbi:hypothetical protein [Mycoplasmopsis bovis]|uniref:hypothetical protein n=1 Tax=Mycoplasmopsis bovis TaxID=28903 RepID=UPI001BDE5AA0